MSTKSTIKNGKNFHLYTELDEENKIYLELNNVEIDFFSNKNGNKVTIAIDKELLKTLSKEC